MLVFQKRRQAINRQVSIVAQYIFQSDQFTKDSNEFESLPLTIYKPLKVHYTILMSL